MPKRITTWLSPPDAILYLDRQKSQLGTAAEQIVESAIRSPRVRKRARASFEVQLREVDWELPADAEIVVYSASVRHRGETIYNQVEVERHDLDAFAAEVYGLLPAKTADKSGAANNGPRAATSGDLARKFAQEILAGLDRKHLRHGWMAEIVRRVMAMLNEHGHRRSESQVRDFIRPELQKWRQPATRRPSKKSGPR